MFPSILSRRITADDSCQAIVDRFRGDSGSPRESLIAFWQSCKGQQTMTLLSKLIKIDMHRRFSQGERPTAGEYFVLFPGLMTENDRAVSLVYEEFCLLEDNQLHPSVSEFCSRYGPWRHSLASQLGYHRDFSLVINSERPKIKYPAVGDRFVSYQLLSLLGEGGAAQVYLATDDLGPRTVVLKVSPSVGVEPSILASLQHRNIVSIFSVVEAPELGLRGISMPYKPGITLDSMLKTWAATSRPRRADQIWQLLKIDAKTVDQGWNEFPTCGTYTEGIAWIGWMVANALAYLHDKKVYHRDIKPANILLSQSEGPLLLDFNLAHSLNAPELAQEALNGGTLPYMAPEQLRAFIDPSSWHSVDAAADIYALGLVLRELVTGRKPEVPDRTIPLNRAINDLIDHRRDFVTSTRAIQPDVPPSLDSIISKCLVFQPSDRYSSAKDVAEDLRRFLKRQPLLVAPNSSWLETVLNWSYRNRQLVAGIGLILCLCGLFVMSRPAPPVRFAKAEVPVEQPFLLESETGRDPPPPGSPAPDFDTSRTSRFQRGIELLGRPDEKSWIEANQLFGDLSRENPRSAWPLIYQGASLEKLGSRGHPQGAAYRLQAQQCIQRASQLADAEAAFDYRLSQGAREVPLLVALAAIRASRGKIASARQILGEVFKVEPNHGGALALLGNIDCGEQQLRAAIEDYRKAIDAFVVRNPRDPYITMTRRALIPLLIIEVNRSLAGKPGDVNLSEAQQLLDRLKTQLVAWEESGSKEPSAWTDCTLKISRAELRSGYGYLFALNRQGDATREFQSARQLFEEAQKLATQVSESKKLSTSSYIQKQLTELERRMRAAHLPERRFETKQDARNGG